MRKLKKGVSLVVAVAMIVQLLPNLVFASELSEQQEEKIGYIPMELIEVTLTEDDVKDAVPSDDGYYAETYSSSSSNYESRYYYNQLSDKQKSLYDELHDECEAYLNTQMDAEEVNVNGEIYGSTNYIECTDLSREELMSIVYLFTISNPQYYFIRSSAALTGYINSEMYVALQIYDDYVSGYTRASYTAQFMSKVNSWVNEVSTESTDYKKVKKAHDIVCENLVYDYDSSNLEKNQSSATAVLNGSTVCAGYAQMFSMLCSAAGIQNICVTSTQHEWNQVNIYDAWYIVDCTWDDYDDGSWGYTYLCKSDSAVTEGDHNPEGYILPYRPTCNTDYIGKVSDYNGNTFYREADENIRCYDSTGALIVNEFMFDGDYTYYMQADGSAMTDRLTYHPDGEHIIYFDEKGHEVFNNFQYCPSVGYTCYFDSQGYIYKDQITFVGDNVYYLNENGAMEQNGWFQFANGRDYGYANWNGTLNTNGFSYDPWGRVVFYHWNGMVARGLITDGVYYYNMDQTDGHYLGQFQ